MGGGTLFPHINSALDELEMCSYTTGEIKSTYYSCQLSLIGEAYTIGWYVSSESNVLCHPKQCIYGGPWCQQAA